MISRWIVAPMLAAALAFCQSGVIQAQPPDGADFNDWAYYDPAKRITVSGIIMLGGLSGGLFMIILNPQTPIDPSRTIPPPTDSDNWRVVLDTPETLTGLGLPPPNFGDRAPVEIEGLLHRTRERFIRAERVTVRGKTAILRPRKEQ